MASLPTSQDIRDSASDSDDPQKSQELILQVLEYGTASHESLEERTKEASKVLSDAWEECPSLEDSLVDALWLRGSILTSMEGTEVSIKALVQLIKGLIQIPDRTTFHTKLQGNLPPSLVGATGLGLEQDLLKRLKQYNTQMHYKQQKYSLLQEESEGFSKALLFLLSGKPKDEAEKRSALDKLLGTFELDPNRILDLCLDILESKLYPHGYDEEEAMASSKNKPETTAEIAWLLGLMKEFALDKLPSLIFFKLAGEDKTESSQSLLRTVAFIVSEGLLNLSSMMDLYSEPIEDEMEEAHKIHWVKEKRRIQALTRISLSGVTKEDPKQAELAEKLEAKLDPLKNSTILKVVLILLEWGEWDNSKAFLSTRGWSQLCDLFPESFGFSLCDIAQKRLEVWYQSKIETPGLSRPWESKKDDADVAMQNNSFDLTVDMVVQSVSEPLLCTVQSGCIGSRPLLYCLLCRLLRSIMTDNDEDEVCISDETYTFFKSFMMPSLSLFSSNPAISTELWCFLKRLPYSTRYRLYADWRGSGLERAGLTSPSGKPLPNVESEVVAGKAARYALKRLSKDNIRDMSRALAKVTHSNPLVVFATILGQIESYDNMVEVMVEAQRFVSPLGLDILGYCILSRLSGISGGVNRSRLKEDGVNVSQWLQSLESFSGAFYKRCPFVEFRGMLSYLMRRLREGKVMELGMLRTLLKVPGGYTFADYSPAASLSSAQLEGRAGSITLKRETMSFGIAEDTNARASERIRRVLQTDGFGVSMLILIAQVRSRILFEASSAGKPVKFVGNLFDSSQVVLSILLDFLTSNEDLDDDKSDPTHYSILKFAEYLPTLEDLREKFGFDVVTAWMLCRPLVKLAEGPDAMDVGGANSAGSEKLKKFALTESFRKSYDGMLPGEVWSVLSFELFEVFYVHSIDDIFVPEDIYRAEITRVTKEIERRKGGTQIALHAAQNSTKNDNDEVTRLTKVSKSLESDLEKQLERVDSIHKDIEERKSKLFKSDEVSVDAANAFFIHCIYPRSLQSPDEAMYCAHFALLLHSQGTPGFSTLHYIDELISVAAGSLFGVTEGEAANLAILLWQTWNVVNKWRYDEKIFEEEVSQKAGSFMESEDGDEDAGQKAVTYKEFEALYSKWHAALGSALIGCLKSPEYMHTRAGLSVLTRMVDVFPTRPKLGNKFLRVLAPLQDESSSRPDIRASANAYCTMLLKARADGKWIEEDAAVAKARAEKDKAAAEERKKKQQEIFKQLKKDSEMITDEIGPRDGPRDRFDRRGRDRRDVPPPREPERGHVVPETGEVSVRVRHEGDRHGEHFRASPAREVDRRRDRERERGDDRGRGGRIDGEWRRDNGAGPHRGSRDEPRESGGRWTRSEVPLDRVGRNAKRSRPSTPEPEPADIREPKRPRVGQESEANYEGRRGASRGSSPPPRGRPPRSRRSGRR